MKSVALLLGLSLLATGLAVLVMAGGMPEPVTPQSIHLVYQPLVKGGSAVSPLTPTMAYRLDCLDLGPYLQGSPGPISEAQLRQLIAQVAPYTRCIRTYTVANGQAAAGRLAHDYGLKANLGLYLSADAAANSLEISAGISLAVHGQADMLIVGNETLYGGLLTPAQLIDYLNQVKADEHADLIRAYLVPAGYTAPPANGLADLPPELGSYAVITATR